MPAIAIVIQQEEKSDDSIQNYSYTPPIRISGAMQLRTSSTSTGRRGWNWRRSYKRGDFVKRTVVVGPDSEWGETLRVRITSIRGEVFRGKLASRPSAAAFANLELGSSIVFRRGHIHSLSRGPALRK